LFWGLVGESEFELAVYQLGDGLAELLTRRTKAFSCNRVCLSNSSAVTKHTYRRKRPRQTTNSRLKRRSKQPPRKSRLLETIAIHARKRLSIYLRKMQHGRREPRRRRRNIWRWYID
jgi:hypothetical protein